MTETQAIIDENCKNIFIKIILLGPKGVGRHSLINRINRIKCHKTLEIKLNNLEDKYSYIIRYNLSRLKISFIFFIPDPAEHYGEEDYELLSNEEDIDIFNKYHMSFTSTKTDIENILPLFMNIDKATTLNYFVFLYDLSDFEISFNELKIYFQILNSKYKIIENYPILLIGTKVDKKKQPKEPIYKEFNTFLELLSYVKHYEIGSKSNFDFNQFFSEFVNYILTSQGIVPKKNIQQIIEKIEEKQHFAKAPKFEKQKETPSPGPGKYLNNIYDTDNMQERIKALTGTNRYNTKFFINKKGPQLHENIVFNKNENPFDKYKIKDDDDDDNDKKVNLQKAAQYLMNVKKGFSFSGGGTKRKGIFLLEERKKKSLIRDELYYNSFNGPTIFNKPKVKNKIKIKKENYDDNKSLYIKEKDNKMINPEKYNSIVKENKTKILKENEDRKKMLLGKIHIFTKKEKNKIKEKYRDLIFGNNFVNLIKADEKIKEIKKIRERDTSPPLYNISKSLLDEKKGFSLVSRKPLIRDVNDIPYVYIKSEFEKCANNKKVGTIGYTKRHSMKIIPLEKNKKCFHEDKLDKYTQNKLNSEIYQNRIDFLNDRKQKENLHNKLMNEKKEQENLLAKKELDIINYNLVENSSPKYSIKGKYNNNNNGKRENILYLFGNNKKNYSFREPRKYEPNYNFIKPKVKSFIFPKDERFKKNKSDNYIYQEPLNISNLFRFLDKKDYQIFETYDYQDKRPPLFKVDDNPGPGNYSIKGFADEIVDKAKTRSVSSGKKSSNLSKSEISNTNI